MRALSGFLVAAFHRVKAKYAALRAKRTKEAPPE